MILDDYLRRTNRRHTSERTALLECVLATKGRFSIDTLRLNAEKTGMRVSVATVYNTVELFVECGLVVRHRFGSRTSMYEKASVGDNHYHLVCTNCGKIKDVHDADLSKMLSRRRYVGFTPAYFAVSVYGVCSACRRKAKVSTEKQTKKSHKHNNTDES